jgi:hypothetical protein
MSESSESESDERQRRKKDKKRRHQPDGEKKKKKHHHKRRKEKHEKKDHRERSDDGVMRSVITGKRIKREEGTVADAEGSARRAALLAHMNEGEDESSFGVSHSLPGLALHENARPDPARMMLLMQQSAELQRQKRQRLGALVRSVHVEGTQLEQHDEDRPRAPHDYKRERAAREAAELRETSSSSFGPPGHTGGRLPARQ